MYQFDLDCSSVAYTMGFLAWVAVTAVGAAVIALPCLAAACLPCLGFGALGPVAGGLAAAAQSWVGSVAAGSIFATLQAMAMMAPTPLVHILLVILTCE